MAGDWVPMRLDLIRDPAVLSVAGQLQIPSTQVLGALLVLWSWASEQTATGRIDGATPAMVDALVGVEGFSAALRSQRWLESDDTSISIPKFTRWMSQSAKARMLTARRQSLRRSRSSVTSVTHKRDASVTRALPDERREDERRDDPPPTPRAGGTVGGNGSASPDPEGEPEGGRTLTPLGRWLAWYETLSPSSDQVEQARGAFKGRGVDDLRAWEDALVQAEAQREKGLRHPRTLIRARVLRAAHPRTAGLEWYVDPEIERKARDARRATVARYSKPPEGAVPIGDLLRERDRP